MRVPATIKLRAALIGLALATLGVGGCAQQPQQFASGPRHGKEYFPSSVYGRASRRVIEDGQPVPHGGGQYLVGKPYTVAGQTYYPSERRIVQVGTASWYGDAFHGRLTANGEIYDRDSFTAAHPTMPLPSYARVTNLTNHYSMIVRVNDRGPYASNRVMDVSRRVAEALDFKRFGTAHIRVEYVGRASLAGSDDAKLYATLNTSSPAVWRGEQPSLLAEIAAAPARLASLAPYAPQLRPVSGVDDDRTGSFAPDRLAHPAQPEVAARREREAPRRDDEGEGRPRSDRADREPSWPRRGLSEAASEEHRPVRHRDDESAPHLRSRDEIAALEARESRLAPAPPRRTVRLAEEPTRLAVRGGIERHGNTADRGPAHRPQSDRMAEHQGPNRRQVAVALPPSRPDRLRMAAGSTRTRRPEPRGARSRNG